MKNARPPSNAAEKDEFDVSDSGSDFGGGLSAKLSTAKPKAVKKPPKKLGPIADNVMEKKAAPKKPTEKAATKKPAAKSKKAAPSGMQDIRNFGAATVADSDDDDMFQEKPKKKPIVKKKKKEDSDGSDFDEPKAKKKKPAAKRVLDSDTGSEYDMDVEDVVPAKERPGRSRAPVNFKGMDSGSGSDSDF